MIEDCDDPNDPDVQDSLAPRGRINEVLTKVLEHLIEQATNRPDGWEINHITLWTFVEGLLPHCTDSCIEPLLNALNEAVRD